MLQGSIARSPAWGFNPEKKQPERLRVWNQFIPTGKIVTPGVPSHVVESWVRSWYYPVDPYPILPISYLSRDQYEQRVQINNHLIPLARGILKNVLKSFGSGGYNVALCDSEGELPDPAPGGGLVFYVWGVLC